MAIDRTAARQRVRTITAWAAGGAAALTAAFAFGAARGTHAAAKTPSRTPRSQDANPQSPYQGNLGPDSGQGFQPPSSSTGPPAGMSGGS